MKQAWLRRVGRGAYLPASLTTLGNVHVLDDPWILVPALFDPAYIGGRTAAEHWDLTEQIFRDIVVMTTQTVRAKTQHRHGAILSLTHISPQKIFGTTTVWRGRSRIAVSDVHRTIVDILADPALGGGIQHGADCLSVYLKSGTRNDDVLLDYAARLGKRCDLQATGLSGRTRSRGVGARNPLPRAAHDGVRPARLRTRNSTPHHSVAAVGP